MTSENKTIDVGALLDASRIGPLPVLVALMGALVLVIDGFDTQVVGYIEPQIAKTWNVMPGQMGYVLGIGQLGILVGNIGLAPFAGRLGPKRVILLSLALITGFTVLSAEADSANWLMAWRFLAGLGIGGSLPAAVALTGEFCPMSWRSTFVVMINLGFTAGQITAGWSARLLLGSAGWRAVLLVGAALPLLLFAAVLVGMPESLEFLLHSGRDRAKVLRILRRLRPAPMLIETAQLVAGGPAKRAVSILALLGSGRMVGTLVIWTAMFMDLGVYYFVQYWLTSLLVHLGVPQPRAIIATTCVAWGSFFTAFTIGPLMDWLGAYRVIIGVFAGSVAIFVVMGLLMAPSPLVPAVMAASAVVGFCISSGQRSLSALAVHFYPVALRSTAVGCSFGAGRAGAFLASVAVGALLQSGWHASGLFYLATVPPLVAVAACTYMARYYGGDRGGPQRRAAEEAAAGVAN